MQNISAAWARLGMRHYGLLSCPKAGYCPPALSSTHTAIVTGANGFIGSHVVRGLLARGWQVHVLGRSNRSGRWQDRVSAALSEAGHKGGLNGQILCHEADLCAPEFDLGSLLRTVFSSGATLFHLAGDTRFRPPDPALQHTVNVDASVRLVRALRGRVDRMIHVSTAYVAGKRTRLVKENELDCGQEFWNSYEKSKFNAELALTALCEELQTPLVIVRPSIITNDRSSGRASTFTHLNAMVEVVSRIQEHYGIADGQVVSKTIRLLADPEARPNLAPVDSILPPLLEIATSDSAPGKVFHLCHPEPQTNLEVIRLIGEAFKVDDRLALDFVESIPEPMSHTERMIFRSLKVYAPYLNNRCEFDLGNSRSLVSNYDSYFSPLNVTYLEKVIEFHRHNRKRSAITSAPIIPPA